MRVTVCGDFSRNDTGIREALLVLKNIDPDLSLLLFYEGAGCLAIEVAKELGIPYKRLDTKWKSYGDKGGIIQNRDMMAEEPDLVMAFRDDYSKNDGARILVCMAKEKHIPTWVSDDGVTTLQETANCVLHNSKTKYENVH